jgi:hypothetical protein
LPNAIDYNTSISASICIKMNTFSKIWECTMMKIAPGLDPRNNILKPYHSKDENI